MAQDFNNFSFVGRLVTDLELTEGSNGKPGYGRARMVTSNYNDDKSVWMTVFFPETVIGRIHEFMTKGKPLAVSGRLTMDNYEDKDGNKRTGLSLNASSVDFVQGQRQEGDDSVSSGYVKKGSKAPVADTDDLPF